MPRGAWATALLLVVTGLAAPAGAQPLSPLGAMSPPPSAAPAPTPSPSAGPIQGLPPAAPVESLPPVATPARPSAPPIHPPPILGAPIAIPGQPVNPNGESNPFPVDNAAVPAAFTDPPAVQKPGRAAGLGTPSASDGSFTTAGSTIPASTVESRVTQTGAAAPAADPVNDFLGRRTGTGYKTMPPPRDDPDAHKTWKFTDRIDDVLGNHGEWFKSDHAFDGFASPVTNPFLFEDPRSLTELRPVFIYQRIPGGQHDFFGGNVSYFGVQGRVAVTERLSFTINKLGGIWLNPNDGAPLGGSSGFSEIWLGPKYTFIRNEATGSLVAGGLQFQVPVGSPGAFQNTGSLSLVPYVSGAQSLFRDFAYGPINVMGTTGYSASTTSARSDYWYISGHVDWDVMNWHHFYPLFEMNYFVTTSNGNTTPVGIEGRDLINFGGHASGTGLLTGAFGARVKISESAQFGGAFEIPFAGPRDLFQYRFTLDFILRF